MAGYSRPEATPEYERAMRSRRVRPQLELAGAVHLVRGAAPGLFPDDDARGAFLRLLKGSCARLGWIAHAWSLSGHRYAIAVSAPAGGVLKGVRALERGFRRWCRAHRETAPSFFPFTSLLVDDKLLPEICREVIVGPVREGLVPLPEKWPWSSHHAAIGGDDPLGLSLEWTRSVPRGGYREWIWKGVGLKRRLRTAKSADGIVGGYEFRRRVLRILGTRSSLPLPALFPSWETEEERDRGILRAVLHFGFSHKDAADHFKVDVGLVGRLTHAFHRASGRGRR